MNINQKIRYATFALLMLVVVAISASAEHVHTSAPFQGPKANKGTVSHSVRDGKNVLTLSDDFVVPDTPDPHWEVVDSKGNVYVLDKLKTKGLADGGFKKEIVLPGYVKNVSKVVIWCAFAETNLGEATFSKAVSK